MQLLSADLRHITLGSLLQVAESDRLDGSFRFDPEGSLVLHKGGVTDAVHGRLKGIDAALTLLMVRSRSAVFEMFDTDDRPPIADTMALIIDGARLNDDWANLAPQVLGIRDGLDRSRLSRELASVVDHLDGTAIVNEAVKQAGVDIILVIDDLLALKEDGHLREVAPPRPERVETRSATPAPVARQVAVPAAAPSTPEPKVGFYDLLDLSRRSLRSKDYGEALALLERAQAIRPDDRTVVQNIRRIQELQSRVG